MQVLGAILAGGAARRFGSDKAEALYDGARLIDHVGAALAQQCDAVIVCGREDPAFTCIPDQPKSGLGPLGGLLAAIQHASANGFGAVLSAPCDVPDLPQNLVRMLGRTGAAFVKDQPVVGLWPVSVQQPLAHALSQDKRAFYAFADRVAARPVALDAPLTNINRPEDMP